MADLGMALEIDDSLLTSAYGYFRRPNRLYNMSEKWREADVRADFDRFTPKQRAYSPASRSSGYC